MSINDPIPGPDRSFREPEEKHGHPNNNLDCQLMIWGVPLQVKRDFKAKCVEKGVSMRETIIEFLKDYTENAGS